MKGEVSKTSNLNSASPVQECCKVFGMVSFPVEGDLMVLNLRWGQVKSAVYTQLWQTTQSDGLPLYMGPGTQLLPAVFYSEGTQSIDFKASCLHLDGCLCRTDLKF